MADKNGNGKWLKILAVLTPFILLAIGAIAGYATNRQKTYFNSIEIKEIKPRVRVVEEAIIEQKADLKWIRREMERKN